jgi:hypothetical protein
MLLSIDETKWCIIIIIIIIIIICATPRICETAKYKPGRSKE